MTAAPTRRVDELAARRVAAAYLAGDGLASGPLVRCAYAQLADQTDALLAVVVRRHGVRLAWTRLETPYAHDDELIASVRATRVLEVPRIDPSRAHPVLGGAPGGAYDRLRALHDLVGHVLPGFGFDRDGELSAWHAQDRLHHGPARWALATELHAHHSVLWTTGHLAPPRPLLLDPRLLRPPSEAPPDRWWTGVQVGVMLPGMSSPWDAEYEPSPWGPIAEEVERYERSGGSEPSELVGDSWIVLWTLGARSGKVRKTPLVRVADGEGRYAVIGSMGGAPTHPQWVHNVRARPIARLQDGAALGDYAVRETEGDEKAEWWARAVAVWPDYDSYQEATERQIPLFVLEPTT